MYCRLEREQQAAELYRETLDGYQERLRSVQPAEVDDDKERRTIAQLQGRIRELSCAELDWISHGGSNTRSLIYPPYLITITAGICPISDSKW
jgi:hypothetical protein